MPAPVNPDVREIRRHSNANVWYSVYQFTKTPFVAAAGATVAQQVAAAISYGALDRTAEVEPGNIYFLEGLPEAPA